MNPMAIRFHFSTLGVTSFLKFCNSLVNRIHGHVFFLLMCKFILKKTIGTLCR